MREGRAARMHACMHGRTHACTWEGRCTRCSACRGEGEARIRQHGEERNGRGGGGGQGGNSMNGRSRAAVGEAESGGDQGGEASKFWVMFI